MNHTIDLSNKVIMITGAAGGIGLATARVFAEVGASLILTDISPEIEDIAQEFKNGFFAIFLL